MIIADKNHIAFKNDQFSSTLAITERNYFVCKHEGGYFIGLFGMTTQQDKVRMLGVNKDGTLITGRVSLRNECYFNLRKVPRTQLITMGSATDSDSEEAMGLLIRAAKQKHGWSVKDFYDRAIKRDNFLFNELLSIKSLTDKLEKVTDDDVDYFFKAKVD